MPKKIRIKAYICILNVFNDSCRSAIRFVALSNYRDDDGGFRRGFSLSDLNEVNIALASKP